MKNNRLVYIISLISLFSVSIPVYTFAAQHSGFQQKNNHVWYLSPKGKQFDLGASTQAFENAKKIATKVGMSDVLTIQLSDEFLAVSTGEVDEDGDGLSDFFETKSLFALFLDSKMKDTDNDGHDDKTELVNGYNPRGDEKFSVDAIAKKHQGELLLSLEDQMLWFVNPSRKLVFLGTSDRFNEGVKKYAVSIPAKAPRGVYPKNDCGIVSTNGVSINVNSSGNSSAKTSDVQGKGALACFNAAYRACKPATIISVANLLPLADVAIRLEIIGKQKTNCKIKETVLVDSTGSYKVGAPDMCLYDMKKIKELSVEKWPDHTQIVCDSDKAKKLAAANKCPLSVSSKEYIAVVGDTVGLSVDGFKGKGETTSARSKNESIGMIKGEPTKGSYSVNGKDQKYLSFWFVPKKAGVVDIEISDKTLKCSATTRMTVYDPLPSQQVELPVGTKDCGDKGIESFDCFAASFTQCSPAQIRMKSGFNSSTQQELYSNTIVGIENGKCKVVSLYLEDKVGKTRIENTRTCYYDNSKSLDDAFKDKSQCAGYIPKLYTGQSGNFEW